MKAIITGASSGFGWDMSHILSEMGYDIVAVARREDRLLKLKEELKTEVEICVCDVTDMNQCKALSLKAKDADVFINNAGFGVFGEFCETDLEKEMLMLDTNVRAVHILTKLVAKEFRKKGSGYIMNVASLASFFPGPMFGAYYASKSYVLRLTQSLAEELRREKSGVKVCVLCPGPAKTEFEKTANVKFGEGDKKSAIVLSSMDVSKYAIKKMFSGKEVIIPGALMRIAVFMRHLLPDKLLARVIYIIQSKKCVVK